MDRDRPGLHVRYDGSVPGDRNSRRAVTGVDGLGERAAGGIDDRNCPVAAQKSYEAARQRPTQESSLPDPMISWGYTSVGNPLPGAGLGSQVVSNIGLMYSQELPYPGKLKLRGEIASKEAEANFQQYQAVQLAIISRLKQAYYRLQYSYAASDLLIRNRDLLNKLVSVTEARYSVGKAAQQDVFKAQTQVSILETRLVKLEQQRISSEAEINSILGRHPGTAAGRPDDVKPKELAMTLDELYAAAAQNSPMLRRDQKRIERAELGVNSARKEYYPDVTLSGGYFNQGSMSPMYQFQASFRVPMYFRRKQRAGVSEQVSLLSGSRRTYEATDQSLHYRIQDDYALAQASCLSQTDSPTSAYGGGRQGSVTAVLLSGLRTLRARAGRQTDSGTRTSRFSDWRESAA